MTEVLVKLGYLAGATRFRRISEKLYIDGDAIYKNAGIDFKASWFPVFYVLAKANSPLTVMEIVCQIDFSRITVKNVVRELEKSDLIIVNPNPTDKRSKKIALSAKGAALLKELKPLWLSFAKVLQNVFESGHPDIINILNRIDYEINYNPINLRIQDRNLALVTILDYKPSLKKYFHELAGNWLLEELDGKLEEEDKFTLCNPDRAYLELGGFVFFAMYKNEVVGCVALKRLDEDSLEFAKLFINPDFRNKGIATKLIERCISRSKENIAKQLWLQTTLHMPEAHKLYYKLGFDDQPAPPQMDVLKRTEKIMCLEL